MKQPIKNKGFELLQQALLNAKTKEDIKEIANLIRQGKFSSKKEDL